MKEKRIEEMAVENLVAFLWHNTSTSDVDLIFEVAELLCKAGYRKQSEGEWIKQRPNPEAMKAFHELGLGKGMSINSIYWTCSLCGNFGTLNHKYCPRCGARMKGVE